MRSASLSKSLISLRITRRTSGLVASWSLQAAFSISRFNSRKVRVAGSAPIVQVASGGVSVWALASNGNPYVLKGKSFALANNISLSQIAVGGGNASQADEVWALNSSGSIYRAHKSGTSWVFSQVAGFLDGIVVGPGYQDTCHPR